MLLSRRHGDEPVAKHAIESHHDHNVAERGFLECVSLLGQHRLNNYPSLMLGD